MHTIMVMVLQLSLMWLDNRPLLYYSKNNGTKRETAEREFAILRISQGGDNNPAGVAYS